MDGEVLTFPTLRLVPREVALTLSLRIGSNAIPDRAKAPNSCCPPADVSFKPYVEPWLSRRGGNPLRDAPKDPKHPHRLIFATAVDGVKHASAHEPIARSIGACIPARLRISKWTSRPARMRDAMDSAWAGSVAFQKRRVS